MDQKQPENVIHHFSHPHSLQLSHHHPQQTLSLNLASSCSGCKLKASGLIYSCKPCNYFLHISCSRMPQQITHSFHTPHPLSLFPTPPYPEGLFNCDACGKPGNGFSYHCPVCNIDLHILCASKPMSVTHQSHHHKLALSFSPPYQNKSFRCDICWQTGSNHWLYRCERCEFDAHLSCATAKPTAPIQTASRAAPHGHFPGNQTAMGHQQVYIHHQSQTTPRPSRPLHGQFSTGQNNMQQHLQTRPWTQFGTGQNHPGMNQVNNQNHPGVYGPVRPAGTILSQAIDGLVNGAAQQLGMSMVQGLLGGGGGSTAVDGGGGGGSTIWDGGSSSASYDYYCTTDTGGGSVDFQDTTY